MNKNDSIGSVNIPTINEIDSETQRWELIQQEREKYLRSEGISYIWEEVKEMVQNNEKLLKLKESQTRKKPIITTVFWFIN